jgi:hypothetical protein
MSGLSVGTNVLYLAGSTTEVCPVYLCERVHPNWRRDLTQWRELCPVHRYERAFQLFCAERSKPNYVRFIGINRLS